MVTCPESSRDPGRRCGRAAGVLVCLLLVAACAREVSTAPAPDPALVAGDYGQAGRFAMLRLTTGGEYECWVTNGISADGCGTFVGSGISSGTWSCRDGAIEFLPTSEPPELVESFAGARAEFREGELWLTIEGREYAFGARDPAGPPAGLRF